MTRVLFADDQIPWDDEERNAKVRTAIVTELGKKLREQGKEPERAYEEDKLWMGELIQYLSVNHGFDVVSERAFQEAEKRIIREKFDIYVIDLSWNGDPNLPPGKRSNVGLQLLELIAKHNPTIPVIAFSQNFMKDAELMSTVLKHNAFPLQKHYSSIDYQSLAGAIAYLTHVPSTSRQPANGSNSGGFGRTFWDLLSRLPLILVVLVVILTPPTILVLAHFNTKIGETVTVLGFPLYPRGW
jgi:CheY-like chemotaxis protein